MRLRKILAQCFTGSTLVVFLGLTATGGLACGDAVLKCCRCQYGGCTDPVTMTNVNVCDCSDYTYEECGLYCEQTLPARLAQLGVTNCGPPQQALAIDGCPAGTTPAP